MIEQLNLNLLHQHVDLFCEKHTQIRTVFSEIGYPKLYVRKPGFETLVKIILGQQVSLASALSAYIKLTEKVRRITPKSILSVSDEVLKQCYFSRQKIVYVKALSSAITEKKIDLKQMAFLSDEVVIEQLTKVKGIGTWTAEVYLLQALRRPNIFPLGDLAAINGLKAILKIEDKAEIIAAIESFRPYRTSLLFFAWHYYAYSKKLKIIL